MWKITYNLLVHIALPFFLLAGLFKTKIRRNLLERLLPVPGRRESPPTLWIHAASVGEAMIAEALITYLSAQGNISRFCVTTNTYYTQELLSRRLAGRDAEILALPLDLPLSLHRFMKHRSFQALLVVETEIWPNLFWAAKSKGLPVIIVNGRISDRTLRGYRRLSFFLGHVVPAVHMVLAQSAEHADRFVSIGFPRNKVLAAGNMKYYRSIEPLSHPSSSNMTVTFGSVREKEFEIVLPVIKRLRDEFPDLTIYIAPREMNLVESLLERIGDLTEVVPYSSQRINYPAAHKGVWEASKKHTTVMKQPSGYGPAGQSRGIPGGPVVVVDTVGELLHLYGLSRIAFVGGSLAPYGGQNILEPLFFGTPVLFGPWYENFAEIGDEIIREEAGVMVHTGDQLYGTMRRLLIDSETRDSMGKKGLKIIEQQRKVMAAVCDAILATIAVPSGKNA